MSGIKKGIKRAREPDGAEEEVEELPGQVESATLVVVGQNLVTCLVMRGLLSISGIGRLARVCRKWRTIMSAGAIWHTLVARDFLYLWQFSHKNLLADNPSWRALYVQAYRARQEGPRVRVMRRLAVERYGYARIIGFWGPDRVVTTCMDGGQHVYRVYLFQSFLPGDRQWAPVDPTPLAPHSSGGGPTATFYCTHAERGFLFDSKNRVVWDEQGRLIFDGPACGFGSNPGYRMVIIPQTCYLVIYKRDEQMAWMSWRRTSLFTFPPAPLEDCYDGTVCYPCRKSIRGLRDVHNPIVVGDYAFRMEVENEHLARVYVENLRTSSVIMACSTSRPLALSVDVELPWLIVNEETQSTLFVIDGPPSFYPCLK